MEEPKRKIELHNYEVEEMLGRVPGWITRNGIVLFLFLIMLLLFGSWMLKYPEIKRARITVTSVNPPADLEARVNGKIERLLVTDNEQVSGGDVLAMIENPANFEDVIKLKQDVAFLDTLSMESVAGELPEMRNDQIGNLQPDYSALLKAYKDYLEFKRIDSHRQRIEGFRSRLANQQAYSANLMEQAESAEAEYTIAQRQYNRNADLFEEEVISESDLDNSYTEMLTKKNKWQEIRSRIAENEIEAGRIQEQILDEELGQDEEASGYRNTLEVALNNLKASIAAWEQDYLLVAPVSGIVSFTRFWSENQNVEAGETVLTIIPSKSGSLLGKIRLPLEGAGKVKKDQDVNVQFDNFPYLEFGMVGGTVVNISEIPDEDYYIVEVEFPHGLTTYYGEEIPFSQNMQGQAEILTDKKRILMRVLEPIKSSISRQVQM